MRILRLLFFTLIIFSVGYDLAAAEPISTFFNQVPKGLHLGLDREAFRKLRPEAVSVPLAIDLDGKPDPAFTVFGEMMPEPSIQLIAYWFKGTQLAAIELNPRPGVSKLAVEVNSGFFGDLQQSKGETFHIISPAGLVPVPIKVWHKNQLTGYFAALPKSTRIIYADSALIPKDKLFLSADKLPQRKIDEFQALSRELEQ